MFLKIKNHTIKGLSAFLSAVTLFCAFTTNISATSHKNLSSKQKVVKRNIPRKFNISLKQQASRRDFLRKYICNMSDESVKDQLNYEIAKYIDRAPDIFEIDKNLINKADPRALLINLSTLNYLFDKYDLFTKKFIEFKRQTENKSFVLMSNEAPTCLQATPIDLSGFYLNNLDNYLEKKQYAEYGFKINFWSARNTCEAYESTIVHEFGHLMAELYTIKKHNIDLSGINTKYASKLKQDMIDFLDKNRLKKTPKPTIYDNKLKVMMDQSPLNLPAKDKEYLLNSLRSLKPSKQNDFVNILSLLFKVVNSKTINLKIAIQNESERIKRKLTESLDVNNVIQCPMGTYGNSYPNEFVSEAFVHLECSKYKNISPLGEKIEKFLVEDMGYLSKSKTIF